MQFQRVTTTKVYKTRRVTRERRDAPAAFRERSNEKSVRAGQSASCAISYGNALMTGTFWKRKKLRATVILRRGGNASASASR